MQILFCILIRIFLKFLSPSYVFNWTKQTKYFKKHDIKHKY